MDDRGWEARDIARIAVFAALIVVLGLMGPIPVPGLVPITAQTLGVMLAGTVLGPKRAAAAVLVVLALVAIGLPVLSGGRGGLGVFLGPTVGFLLGWLPAAVVTGLIAQAGRLVWWRVLLGALIGGVPVVYAVGVPLQALVTGLSLGEAALSSLVSAVLLPRAQAMTEFRFWQVGGVGGADWGSMAVVVPVVTLAAVVVLLLSSSLNALALGDDVAAGLGVHVGRTRAVAAAAGVVLCAAVTSVAGPIAFVGLMVPHAMRLLSGPDQRWLLPLSALGGAVLLTVADTLGRLIGGTGEVEAGILTAFLGAPVLVAIARRTRMKGL